MIEARELPREALDDRLDRWLASARRDWFRGFLACDPSREAAATAARIRAAAAIVVEARQDGIRVGLAAVELLDWDSRHFGVPVARVAVMAVPVGLPATQEAQVHRALLGAVGEWARSSGIGLLVRRLIAERLLEIRALEAAGFRLADHLVTLTAPVVAPSPSGVEGVVVRAATPEDRVAVLGLVDEAGFVWSRFLQDPLLAPRGLDVYRGMVGNLLSQGVGTLACRRDGAVLGLMAWRNQPEVDAALMRRLGQLDFLLVHPDSRGLGLGRLLLAEMMAQMAAAGMELAETTTWAAQRAAMATYQGAGFRVGETLLSFHLPL